MTYKLIKLGTVTDSRGKLTAIEGNKNIPFCIKRIFYMHNILSNRGGHAHIDTDQVIIAIHGSFNVKISNGEEYKTFYLNNPEIGLYIPRLTFTDFSKISKDAVCLVLANTHYDISKSLRNFNDFLSYLKNITEE
jgi:dTDP-4-dehydrorhamnose 3,5-epimerase-like enzyme